MSWVTHKHESRIIVHDSWVNIDKRHLYHKLPGLGTRNAAKNKGPFKARASEIKIQDPPKSHTMPRLQNTGSHKIPSQKQNSKIQDTQEPTSNLNVRIQDPQDPTQIQIFRIQDSQDATKKNQHRRSPGPYAKSKLQDPPRSHEKNLRILGPPGSLDKVKLQDTRSTGS